MNQNTNPPPGWYPDPAAPNSTRWWDGYSWTDHAYSLPLHADSVFDVTAPPASATQIEAASPGEGQAARRQPGVTYYWENLLRIRYWWFTLGGSLFLSAMLAIILPSAAIVAFWILAALLGWFWLTVQMACRHCGRLLGAAKVSGPVLICPSCNQFTEEGLKRQ